MKRAILILLIVAMVGAAVHSYADETELSWGMNQDEVCSIIGYDYTSVNELVSAEYEAIGYSDQSISKFDSFYLILFFANNSLVAKEYELYNEKSLDKYDYLLNALSGKYNSCGQDKDTFRKYQKAYGLGVSEDDIIDDMLNIGLVFSTWLLEDETRILLYAYPTSKDGYNLGLFYFAPDSYMPEIKYDDTGL